MCPMCCQRFDPNEENYRGPFRLVDKKNACCKYPESKTLTYETCFVFCSCLCIIEEMTKRVSVSFSLSLKIGIFVITRFRRLESREFENLHRNNDIFFCDWVNEKQK